MNRSRIAQLMAWAVFIVFSFGLHSLGEFSRGSGAQTANRIIYPEPEQSRADLAAALKRAPVEHKRVLVDFGGNWCGDCQVLDIYFHNDKNRALLEENFILVHVNVGHFDANLDIAKKYEIPLEKGVPAVAVLSEQGKLLYSQKTGEFESMRRMNPASVTEFLASWRPTKPGCSTVVVNC